MHVNMLKLIQSLCGRRCHASNALSKNVSIVCTSSAVPSLMSGIVGPSIEILISVSTWSGVSLHLSLLRMRFIAEKDRSTLAVPIGISKMRRANKLKHGKRTARSLAVASSTKLALLDKSSLSLRNIRHSY